MSTQPLQPVGIKSQAVNFRALPPLSLYIHIPWCVRKCPYCDFNSHEARGGIPEEKYVAALVRDLEMALPSIWGRKVYTVFFGGGTPSLLSGAAVEEIMRHVRMLLPLDINAEVTLEANPGTVEAGRFAAYRAAGVNRLSLGIQSFSDVHLKALGRIHSSDEARRAIQVAQQHFDNINLDLMYALPGQTLEGALQDVQTALSFTPQHLSCYHLTLEPNTLFYLNPPPLPDDDVSAGMQEHIEAMRPPRLRSGHFSRDLMRRYSVRLGTASGSFSAGSVVTGAAPLPGCIFSIRRWWMQYNASSRRSATPSLS